MSSALALGSLVPLALLAACSSASTTTTSTTSTTTSTSGAGGGGGAGGAGGAGGGFTCTGTGVSKGPWSLAADATSVKIRWETCRASVDPFVSYALEAGGPS